MNKICTKHPEVFSFNRTPGKWYFDRTACPGCRKGETMATTKKTATKKKVSKKTVSKKKK